MRKSLTLLVLMTSLAACRAASPGDAEPQATASAPAAQTQPNPQQEVPVNNLSVTPQQDDLSRFIPAGSKQLAVQRADLDGDGREDAVLVIDPPAQPDAKLGEGAPRTVVVLIRDAAGKLQAVKRSERLVPCAKCGGIAGDPFGYVRAYTGGFTVLIEGGSRERWSDEFGFAYSAEQQDWLLEKAVRSVVDTDTGEDKRLDLQRKDFGAIRLEEFDRDKLPSVEGT